MYRKICHQRLTCKDINKINILRSAQCDWPRIIRNKSYFFAAKYFASTSKQIVRSTSAHAQQHVSSEFGDHFAESKSAFTNENIIYNLLFTVFSNNFSRREVPSLH